MPTPLPPYKGLYDVVAVTMIRAWAKIGEKLAGEQKLVGQAPHGEDGRDPAQVIKEYRAKYNDALHKKEHPDHEARVEGLRKLYDRAYGA